jgi:hypothetical protein
MSLQENEAMNLEYHEVRAKGKNVCTDDGSYLMNKYRYQN